MRLIRRPLRLLDFDCESRPLGYIGDYTHDEITVIAWSWIGSDEFHVESLSKDERSRGKMLRAFRTAYDEADIVVGHYIRRFDLPLVNAMIAELGDPPLSQKMAQDTKQDLPKMKGISKSQVNLAAMFGVDEEKIRMTVPAWRNANRLTKTGVAKAKDRAVFDVAQNIALREELLARGLLGPPRLWRPS